MATIPLVPYFVLVSCTMVSYLMRMRPGARQHARDCPFASLFVCVVTCFGGTIVANALMAKPIIDIFLNSNGVHIVTLMWYLVFFCPLDIVWKIINIKPVLVFLVMLIEVPRVRNIKYCVQSVMLMYPTSPKLQIAFVAVLIGSIRGSSVMFILRPLDGFIRGNITADNEFLNLSFPTKNAFVSSVLITLQHTGILDIDESILLMVLVVFGSSIHMMILLFKMKDPYEIVEDLLAAIFIRVPDELVGEENKVE